MADRVDLNADVGEGIGQDPELVPLVTSVNVACGVHAGDAATMRATVRLARAHGVAVGAHPSFPDRAGFGRRAMTLSAAEIEDTVAAQVRTLSDVASGEGVRLQHAKAHGALYNVAAADEGVANAVVRGIVRAGSGLIVFAPPRSQLLAAAQRAGLPIAREAFADRAYTRDGALVPRDRPGAVIDDADAVVARALTMVRDGAVTSVEGSQVLLQVDTICVHGDTAGAAALARRIRRELLEAGVSVRAVGSS